MDQHANLLSANLQSIENRLINDFYIEVYDALSIAIVDVDNGSRNECPRMEGLRHLCSHLLTILDEAQKRYELQITKLNNDALCMERLSNEISAYCEIKMSSTIVDNDDVDEDDDYDADDGNKENVSTIDETKGRLFLREYKKIEASITSSSRRNNLIEKTKEWHEQHSLLFCQLKYEIQSLYCCLISNIDAKLDALLKTRRIFDLYSSRIYTIAVENNVFSASTRVELVVNQHFPPILEHTFFKTYEDYRILDTVCKRWATVFMGNPRHAHMADRLLSKRSFYGSSERYRDSFYWKAGCICILLLGALSECVENEFSHKKIWHDPSFSIFMVFGNLILLFLMWGLCISIWNDRGVNYVRLLQLQQTELGNAKRIITHMDVHNAGADMAILYLLVFIAFNKFVRAAYIPVQYTHLLPLGMAAYFLYRLVLPTERRAIWWNMLWPVLGAPLYPVSFRDGYVGDLLTSLVRVMLPLASSTAYLLVMSYGWISNRMDLVTSPSDELWAKSELFQSYVVPLITLTPLFIRLLQCLRRCVETGQRWPHMMNGLKYTSAILVLSYGIAHPQSRGSWGWLLAFVGATLFQFTWDVFQDWGLIVVVYPDEMNALQALFDGSVKMRFRSQRLFGSLHLYISIVAVNLVLRFAWALTLLPPPDEESSPSPLYVLLFTHAIPIAASVEVVRRMVWGILRLEHEQLEQLDDKTILQSRETAPLLATPGKKGTLSEDFRHFEKMGTKGSVDVSTQGSVNAPLLLPGSDSFLYAVLTCEWERLLPHFCLRFIESRLALHSSLRTMASKLRFLEAALFILALMYLLMYFNQQDD